MQNKTVSSYFLYTRISSAVVNEILFPVAEFSSLPLQATKQFVALTELFLSAWTLLLWSLDTNIETFNAKYMYT